MFAKLARASIALLVATGLALVPAVTAQAASNGIISVQLVDQAGKPWKVGEIAVSINSTTSNYYRQATSDYRGIVTFKSVPTSARLTVQAHPEYNMWYVGGAKGNVTVSKNKTTKVAVKVAMGGSVSGIIRTSAGVPLAQSKVTLLTTTGAYVQEKTTDESGYYKFSGLRTGTYKLQFNSRQYVNTNAARTYSWAYWGAPDGDWSAAKTISIVHQGAKVKPSALTKGNITLPRGTTVTASLAEANPGGQIEVKRYINGVYFDKEYSIVPLAEGGQSVQVRLAPGTYIVGVPYQVGGSRPMMYYTGEGQALTEDFNAAVPVEVPKSADGAQLSLTFGALPAS